MSSQSNDTRISAGTSALGVIVCAMRAPVRFRRKALAVAAAFVVATATAACTAGVVAGDGAFAVGESPANAGCRTDTLAQPVSHTERDGSAEGQRELREVRPEGLRGSHR